MKNKHTIYRQKSSLDQFYTKSYIAKYCYDKIFTIYNYNDFINFVEPSAGNGSFFNLFPNDKRIGMDIDPKADGITKMNFFDFGYLELNSQRDKNVITIGNPPFGRICSLAIKFFNHAAKFSNVIAFIVPKTFKKQSIKNKLNLNFKLILSEDLPSNSFIFNDEEYHVPCCFQIWEKSSNKRQVKVISLNNDLFDFSDKEHANMAIRRVGGRAGKAFKVIKDLSKSSNYFLNFKSKRIKKDKFIDIVNSIDFTSITKNTAGVRSLSKPELIQTLKKHKLVKKFL